MPLEVWNHFAMREPALTWVITTTNVEERHYACLQKKGILEMYAVKHPRPAPGTSVCRAAKGGGGSEKCERVLPRCPSDVQCHPARIRRSRKGCGTAYHGDECRRGGGRRAGRRARVDPPAGSTLPTLKSTPGAPAPACPPRLDDSGACPQAAPLPSSRKRQSGVPFTRQGMTRW